MNKKIEKIIEDLNNHPALKFANDAITLQAIRQGTKGYTGEENLSDFFYQVLTQLRQDTIKECIEAVGEVDTDNQAKKELRQALEQLIKK